MSGDLLLELLLRGFLQVAPVAANTVFIARGHYLSAALVYGCGASCGVLCGMRVARWMT